MFLIRPYPQVDESLVGYMIRVALANRIRSLSHFRSLVEVKLPEFERNIISEDSLNKLSTLTNQTAAKLKRMSSNLFHEELKNDHFNMIMTRRMVQFCPLCIEEGAYHRKIWLISGVIICPMHEVKL